ncbi:MAG: hypothetical protein ACTH6S_03365 [Mesonia sp.]|uniref:hypothetical protein n=1 Tax=Mesonia sp. TaxID=1960830 RepID=UPI003F95B671
MKKLLAVAVLFTAFSFTSLDANAKRLPSSEQDCVNLAIDVHNAYSDAGYNYEASYQAGNWAYEGCMSDL